MTTQKPSTMAAVNYLQ